ncbi:MAG: PKD domain-containing protein, partial [Bacteroidales bacterium]
VSYLWNFGDGIDSISELPNPVHIYALPGNYSVSLTITNSNGCVDDTMIMITINPLPDVHFSYSQTCLNLNTQFTNQTVHPTNIANWLWKFGDNSTSIQMNPAHKYPAADTFNAKLIATDDLGCSDSLTLAVIIDSLPVAKFKTDTVCLNDATYFTDLSESHGSAINFWHWEFGDGDTAFFQHPNHSYLNPQIYNAQLIVVNTMGCSDTISQSVKIDSLPFANFIYQDTCYNSPTHFYSTSTAQSGILASYSWDFGDGITSNLPNPIHIFNAPGSYYVKLTVTNFIAADSNYCSDDTIILITIYPLPDVHFSYSQTCLNQNTQFINQTNHPTNIGNWLWRFGDNSTSIQANPIHSYLTANTFNVKLIVIDDLGCKDSISQPVIVDSLPVANFVYADTCLNMPTLFTDLSQHHGSNNVSWLWDFDGISQANIQNPSHTFTNPTQYNYNVKLTVSNAMGCKDDTIKQIIVNHIPLADFYFLDTICQLDTLELTDLSTVTASHINKWEWDFGDGGTSTLQHPKHHYQSYGIFYISLTVTDTNGCTDNVMKQLHVVPSPSANFAYTRVCFGDTTFFNDLSSYIYDTINSWDWDFGDGSQHSNLKNPKHFFSTPKTYQVSLSITSSNSDSLYLCRDKIVKNVVVDSLPKANFYTDTVCLKNSVQYHDSSLSHGSANNYWHWTFSDSINIFTQHPVHTFLNDTATHVKLLVVNQMGCKDSISKKVYLNPLPYANFKFSNNPGTCFNDTTCFNSSPWSTTSPGTTLISWLWHFGDGDTSTLQNPCHVYNTSGTYFVKLQITNSNHCQKDTIIKLIISPLQKIMFTYSQTCLGDSTQFTNLTFSNIPIIKFKWNFGDNHYDSTNWNPKHYYTLAKKYNVILSVTDTNLCTAQKIIEIEVDSLPVAHFDFDTVCMNSGTQFTDKSEHHGSVNNLWHWSFDDGSISLIQHPNHAYSYIYPYIATLIVGNQKGCTDTVSHHIVFKTQPVNFTHENTCLHDFTQFTFTNLGYASPVVSWLWNFGDGIDSTSTLKNPKHVYAVPGTYLVRLTIMNADSCLSDTTIAVIIYPTPEVNFSYSQACLHDSTHFVNLTNSVLLVETVKWTFTPFNTILNINNPSFQFSNPGFNPVTLQITDTLGCTAYKTDTVVVDSLPVARFITDTACFNSATSFIDTSEWHGSPNISWYWQFGDGNAAYYHDVLYPYNAAGVYNATLIVTNAKNCKDTVIQQVYVNHPMNVANFILSDTCMGDTTHFTSLSSTSPGTTITKYTWNFGDGTIKITNAVNISHFFHFPGNYYVKLTITNSFGCSKDTIIKVSIRPLPEIHFNYIRGCLGDPTRFINLSDTNHIPYWKWIYGDNYHATNVISPVYKYQLAGVYDVTLIGIDSFGCMDSLTLPINVDTLPIANFKFDSICFHDVTHFTDLSVSYGGDITDWYWDFGDGSFSFFQHPGHQFDSPGTYNVKLIITNIRGCNDTIVKQVKIDSIPIANFTYIKHCLNDITQFHSSAITQTSSTILNYSWDFGDGSGIWNSVYPDFNHQYQFPGTYYVKHTVFNSNHCTDDTTIVVTIYPLPNLFLWHTQTCMGDTTQFVNLSDTIPYNITKWKWIFGDGSIDSIKNPLHLYPPPQYSYNLSLIGIDVNGCSDTISETFKIDSLPIANFTSNKACLHNDTYFTDLSTIGNGSPIVDWHWYFGDGDSAFYQHPQHQYPNSGTYMDTLEVINLMGCKDKIIKPLTINPLPVVNFTDTNLCINDVTKFHSTSTSPGSSILSYTWDFGDGSPVISAISQNITHPYSSPGYYWVRLTVVNADSCINDTVIKIKIHSLPELGFNYTQTCLGDPTHFINLTIHDTLMSSWVWNFNNPPSPGSNTMNPTHTFSNAGTYFVNLIGKDTIGCSNSITLPVKVDSLPHADFSSDINCLHGETHFTDLSTIGFGDSIVDWHWYFGDGDSSFYQHPSHQYPFLNTYQAKLKVINMMGCADSVEKHVIIRPLPIPHFTWKDTCYKQITIFNSITSTTRPGTYITSYIWDFGDGTPLINTPSPVQSHEYLLAGSYLVKLSIINSVDSCSNDTSFMVTIHDLPDVHFNYSQTCLGDLMHFYNLTNLTNSDTNSCSWKWNFGEPSPSTLKNPAHKYQYATSYPVKLIATNSFGCIDSLTQAVKVDSLPFANFTTDIACLHNETHFTDISIGYGSPINDWHWHFSDGDSSSYQHPSHQFPGSGTFNDTLIVINIMGCTDTVVKPVIIRPLPIANFTWSDTTCYNNTTFFTSTSTSRPGTYIDSYYWDFGDGHTTSTNNPYQPIFNNYSLPGSYLVKLTITNFPDACSNDTSFVVTIHPLPDIHYVYTQTCLHDSTHFINLTPNPDSINNWKWIFGDGSPSLITSVFKDTTSHLYLTARTFNTKLIATTLYGCMDSLSVSVKVDSLPKAKFTSDSICLHNATQFTDLSTIGNGSPIAEWNWHFGDGDTASYQHPAHLYDNPGNYIAKLLVINVMGCKDSITDTVKVRPLPIPMFTWKDSCYTDSTHFTSISITNAGSNFINKWYFDDGDSLITTSSIVAHKYLLPGTYYVKLIVQNSYGCKNDTTIKITIHDLPDVHFNYSQACLGDPTHFFNLTNSTVPITKWLWNLGNGIGSCVHFDTIYKYTIAKTYNVTLTVTDTNACISSLTKPVIVDSLPTANFTTTRVCLNDSTHFADLSISHGSPNNYWHWEFGDGDTAFFRHPNHAYPNSQNYNARLIVKNIMGCWDDTTIVVKIDSLPVAKFTFSDTCYKDSTRFYSSVSIPNSIPKTIVSYLWDFGDNDTSILKNPIHRYALPGDYPVKLRVTNINGCHKDTLIWVRIHPLPFVNFNYSQTCIGGITHFYNLTVHDTIIKKWIWSFGDGPPLLYSSIRDTAHKYLAAGNFNVRLIARDTLGCIDTLIKTIIIDSLPVARFKADTVCYLDETHFTDLSIPHGSPVIDWHWKFGDGDSAFSQNPHHQYPHPGTYQVTLKVFNINGCYDSTIKTVLVRPLPVANFAWKDTCFTDSTHFYSTSTSMSGIAYYKWVFDDGDSIITNKDTIAHKFLLPGSYWVQLTVKNSDSCQKDTTIFITIHDLPDIHFNYSQACLGDSMHFYNLTVHDTAINQWIWNFGDGPPLLNSSIRDTAHLYQTAGTFDVKLFAKDVFGCTDSLLKQVVVDSLPTANFSLDPACLNIETHFIDLSSPNGDSIIDWHWYFGDGDSANYQNPHHIYHNLGTDSVKLIITNFRGCKDTINSEIIVHTLPNADFTSTPNLYSQIGFFVSFKDLSTVLPGDILSQWKWNFGEIDLLDDTTQNPGLQKFTIPGSHLITLVVKNQWGCPDTAQRDMIILGNNGFFAPNAFTPDQDQLDRNEIFIPDGTFRKDGTFEMYIYNRWGQQVFETHTYKGWDGKFKNEYCMNEVYVWLVRYIDINGDHKTAKGIVTLIR